MVVSECVHWCIAVRTVVIVMFCTAYNACVVRMQSGVSHTGSKLKAQPQLGLEVTHCQCVQRACSGLFLCEVVGLELLSSGYLPVHPVLRGPPHDSFSAPSCSPVSFL